MLVDDILPPHPIRQWVLSFPFALRYLFATRPVTLSHVLAITYRVAVGPRAGQKAFTLQTLPPLPEHDGDEPPYLAKANGFSLPQGTLS